MRFIVQAILSAAGVLAATIVARDTISFPIYQFAISLIFIVIAAAIAIYWPKIFER